MYNGTATPKSVCKLTKYIELLDLLGCVRGVVYILD